MENRIDKLLSSVAEDLWGAKPQEPAPSQPAAAPTQTYQPTFPPFEQLWKTADETVDWTEALIHAEPVDHLTSRGCGASSMSTQRLCWRVISMPTQRYCARRIPWAISAVTPMA